MKEVNLEYILKSYLTTEVMNANKPDYTFNMVLSAMKEACRQTLIFAAENAKSVTELHPRFGYCTVIDKESILNTINQVK